MGQSRRRSLRPVLLHLRLVVGRTWHLHCDLAEQDLRNLTQMPVYCSLPWHWEMFGFFSIFFNLNRGVLCGAGGLCGWWMTPSVTRLTFCGRCGRTEGVLGNLNRRRRLSRFSALLFLGAMFFFHRVPSRVGASDILFLLGCCSAGATRSRRLLLGTAQFSKRAVNGAPDEAGRHGAATLQSPRGDRWKSRSRSDFQKLAAKNRH